VPSLSATQYSHKAEALALKTIRNSANITFKSSLFINNKFY